MYPRHGVAVHRRQRGDIRLCVGRTPGESLGGNPPAFYIIESALASAVIRPPRSPSRRLDGHAFLSSAPHRAFTYLLDLDAANRHASSDSVDLELGLLSSLMRLDLVCRAIRRKRELREPADLQSCRTNRIARRLVAGPLGRGRPRRQRLCVGNGDPSRGDELDDSGCKRGPSCTSLLNSTPGPASGAVPTNVAVNWPGTVEFRSRGEDNDRRGATPSCWYRGRGPGDDAECTSGSAIRTLRVHGGAGHRRPRSLHGTMRGVSSARPSGEQRGRAARGRELHDDWRTRTAGDLAKDMQSTMPPGGAGSLSLEDYINVTAFVLAANSAQPGATSLTLSNRGAHRQRGHWNVGHCVIGGGAGGGGADPAAAGQQAGGRSREAGRRGVTVVGEVANYGR